MKITVVTISFNAGRGLQRTVASVIAQTHSDIEWIIIDGGSTDGSLDALAPHRARIASLVSEPDRGIADAMNKGVARSTGEAVIFMNAGDEFSDAGALARLMDTYRRSPNRWVVGGAEVRRENGDLLYQRLPPPEAGAQLVRYGCRISHSSTLLSVATLRELGGFHAERKIAMDYDLWVRLYRSGYRPSVRRDVVSIFYLGGASANIWRRWCEDYFIRRRYGCANGGFVEFGIMALAGLKHEAAALRAFPMAYRLKEWLRI